MTSQANEPNLGPATEHLDPQNPSRRAFMINAGAAIASIALSAVASSQIASAESLSPPVVVVDLANIETPFTSIPGFGGYGIYVNKQGEVFELEAQNSEWIPPFTPAKILGAEDIF